jgi:hypothetical protein
MTLRVDKTSIKKLFDSLITQDVTRLYVGHIDGIESRPIVTRLTHLYVTGHFEDHDFLEKLVLSNNETLRVLHVVPKFTFFKVFESIVRSKSIFHRLYAVRGDMVGGAFFRPSKVIPQLTFFPIGNTNYIRNNVPIYEKMSDMFKHCRGNVAKLNGVVTTYLCMQKIGIPRDVRCIICNLMFLQAPWIDAADFRLEPDDIVEPSNFRALERAFERFASASAHLEIEQTKLQKNKFFAKQAFIDRNKAKIEYEQILSEVKRKKQRY